MTKNNIYFATV